MDKPIRALHILPQFQPGGGIDRVVLNYLQNVDRNRVEIDIVCHQINDSAYAEIASALGSKVHVLPPFSLRNFSDIQKKFTLILKDGEYDVIHCHMANAAFLYLKIAEKYSIPVRILHSHQDNYADTYLHSLRNYFLVQLGKNSASKYLACSVSAGDFLFGKKRFTVLPNAIDTEGFRFSQKKRELFRKTQRIKADEVVFGFAGRFVEQKNPVYLLEIFSEIKSTFKD